VDNNSDVSRPWYHGSPSALDVLRAGSTITQRYDLARIFSHKPSIVSISDEGRILHSGTTPGYLYEIAEPVREEDIVPHPRTTMGPGDEWLTGRELRLRLIAETAVRPAEYLSEAAVETLRRKTESLN